MKPQLNKEHRHIMTLTCVACEYPGVDVRPRVLLIDGEGGSLLLCDACQSDVRIVIRNRIWRIGE